jgi:hypothetical protein
MKPPSLMQARRGRPLSATASDQRLVRCIAWFSEETMKQTERRTYEQTVVVKVICDLCGAKGHAYGWPETDGGGFEVNDTTVRFKTGKQYPESGSGVVYEVDICPACFTAKLIPWLQSQGATVRETEWETG